MLFLMNEITKCKRQNKKKQHNNLSISFESFLNVSNSTYIFFNIFKDHFLTCLCTASQRIFLPFNLYNYLLLLCMILLLLLLPLPYCCTDVLTLKKLIQFLRLILLLSRLILLFLRLICYFPNQSYYFNYYL